MIHMMQCLCGPNRHCITAMLYDDKDIATQDVEDGMRAMIEMQVDHKIINRRCEMCDKDVIEFIYEDRISKEQDWDKAKSLGELLEAAQRETQRLVKSQRKAENN
jgi:hypothetical protein